MILLDTCAIIYAALTPEKLPKNASVAITRGVEAKKLACSDISLLEMAMLISKGRLKPDADPRLFITRVLTAYNLAVLPIIPEIAVLSADETLFSHKDPCDRIIASTAMHHKMPLITSDASLRTLAGLKTIWA
ncbi:MAG: type II toxin-antitoxin system VapC family toxin [Deltaproteobacteria bacterium]|nr:type II toxin-antitoxin system VapC family toxin [Deltaproteobacteria bacterium]